MLCLVQVYINWESWYNWLFVYNYFVYIYVRNKIIYFRVLYPNENVLIKNVFIGIRFLDLFSYNTSPLNYIYYKNMDDNIYK